MLRVLTKIPAARLNRHKNGPSRLYRTVRFYSKQELCPPPAPKSGGSGTMYTIGALVLVTGATVGYAKYDPEFRKWLAETAPFTDDVIKFIFQEDKSVFDRLKNVSGMIGQGDEPIRKSKTIKEVVKSYEAPAPVFPKVAEKLKNADDYAEIRLEKKIEGAIEPIVEIVGDIKKIEISKLPIDIIAELEKTLAEEATSAIKAYNKSVYALKNYSNDVEIVVEESIDRVDPSIWSGLRQKAIDKDEAIKSANKHADEATKSIAKLKEMLRKNLDVPAILIERSKTNIQKVQDDLTAAKNELEKEKRKLNVTEKYWNKVDEARKYFNKELEALFPTIDFEKKNVTIADGDMDLFVLHAMSQVLYYQKELYKLETITERRLNEAIETAKQTGQCDVLTTEQICEKLEKEKRILELDYKNKCLKLRHDTESELRDKLKLQSEAFTDHLDDAVKTREMELERLLNRKYDEKLTEERSKYKMQVSAMVGRLRGMEEAMKVRADADKTSQQAQILWSACQALFKSVKAGCPGAPWTEQLRPLNPEIQAVKRASADGDELVTAVIEGIPEMAKQRGVFPEDALRERFLKVEQVARSLALLPEHGGRLHMYFLSYIQSLLLLNAANPIPLRELNDEQVDFTKLSTNDILQRARYWLDRGDFSQTLKYMNLLKGAPRSVAKQWMNETRILLETQQAANTLMAYAAASGLIYL